MPARTTPPLGPILGELLGVPIESVDVVRSEYSTSFPIDDVTVWLTNGTRLDLVRKDLSWTSLLPPARRAKPAFVYEPRREMSVYVDVLEHGPRGPARCFGVVDRPQTGPRWLFLERLEGVELYQVGELDRWAASAEWAGRFHARFQGETDAIVSTGVPLLVHDWPWLRRWADRAVAGAVRDHGRALRHLRACAGALWARLAEQPTTLIHGELYASNVIVHGTGPTTRVSPVDWEMAAVAPGLVDLAALTAGPWSPAERRTLERAYAVGACRQPDEGFGRDLDACRLAMCLQWLGWKRRWRAPSSHSFDWLTEALSLADQLEL